jgi:FkbM family methyltransferase
MRKVFIDCGTNMGMGFADISPRYGVDESWEIFGFEPNVYSFVEYDKNIKSGRYPSLKGKNIRIFQKAVWDKDTVLSFCCECVTEHYGQDRIDDLNQKYSRGESLDFIDYDLPATGGSCVMEIKEKLKRTDGQNKILEFKETIEVDAIDFSLWVSENFSPDDLIILKMDIEGSEYKVLPKMINDGSIKYINDLIIEWHDWELPEYSELTLEIENKIKSLGVNVKNWG